MRFCSASSESDELVETERVHGLNDCAAWAMYANDSRVVLIVWPCSSVGVFGLGEFGSSLHKSLGYAYQLHKLEGGGGIRPKSTVHTNFKNCLKESLTRRLH